MGQTMNKEKFWEIIEEARNVCLDNIRDMADELEKRLLQYSVEDVQKFCGIYDAYHKAMDKPGIESIAFLMNHNMLTYDGFTDFRNWMIAQGKDAFFKTMENPEFLAEHNGQSIEGWYEFEQFGYVGMTVIERKTGDYKLAYKELNEDEENSILSEITFGEYVDKNMSIAEMQKEFPEFSERYMNENCENISIGRMLEYEFAKGLGAMEL